MFNTCPRCGKPRIVAKEWKEKVTTAAGVTTVVRQLTVCPDPACQEIVDQKREALFEKSTQIQQAFDKRSADKKKERSQLRFAKAKVAAR